MEATKEQKVAFGRELMRAREEKGLSRAAIAVAVGMSEATVGGWERGDNCPRRLHTVRILEEALETEPDHLAGLLGWSMTPPPPTQTHPDIIALHDELVALRAGQAETQVLIEHLAELQGRLLAELERLRGLVGE